VRKRVVRNATPASMTWGCPALVGGDEFDGEVVCVALSDGAELVIGPFERDLHQGRGERVWFLGLLASSADNVP
jgi:hypothetical protein